MAWMRHRVRWRSVGAAITFVLAAVAGVVGNRLTGHMTLALMVFAVLLVAGMAVTFLLERSASGRASGDDQGTGTAAEEAGTWGLRGTQGVQVGDGNRQVNYFGAEPRPDRGE